MGVKWLFFKIFVSFLTDFKWKWKSEIKCNFRWISTKKNLCIFKTKYNSRYFSEKKIMKEDFSECKILFRLSKSPYTLVFVYIYIYIYTVVFACWTFQDVAVYQMFIQTKTWDPQSQRRWKPWCTFSWWHVQHGIESWYSY